METGTIKMPAVSALNAPQRADTAAFAGAVKTQLPPDATVQQVEEAQAVQFQPTDGARSRAALDAALREFIDRKITIDPRSREVVYQAIDQRTGEVVRQVPDEALLRLRTYARAMRDKQQDPRPHSEEKLA